MNILEKLFIIVIAIILFFSASCNEKPQKNEAKGLLDSAKGLYQKGEYGSAIKKLDSLKRSYPEAVNERKEGFNLLQQVRKAQNDEIIKRNDSLLVIYNRELDNLKKMFIFKKDPKYQDKGFYIPQNDPSVAGNSLGLRSGVNEDNSIFIESVYTGTQKHHSVKVSIDKGSKSAQTKSENGDGLNYRSGNAEIIRFTPMIENGIIEFIVNNKSYDITVELIGNNNYSYRLSKNSKDSILQSFKLSELMKKIESLLNEKYKAITLNEYLESKINN